MVGTQDSADGESWAEIISTQGVACSSCYSAQDKNEELWVHQLHTAPKNASRHLETRQTMDSASREPEDNIKVSCESEKFYFILDSSRPCKSHSPLHQNVVSEEEARKGVNTWDTGHFIQMEEWTPSEKDGLNYQPWQLQTWSDI